MIKIWRLIRSIFSFRQDLQDETGFFISINRNLINYNKSKNSNKNRHSDESRNLLKAVAENSKKLDFKLITLFILSLFNLGDFDLRRNDGKCLRKNE